MTWVTWVCTARGGGAGGAGGGHYSQQDGRKEQERGAVLAPCQCLSPCLSLPQPGDPAPTEGGGEGGGEAPGAGHQHPEPGGGGGGAGGVPEEGREEAGRRQQERRRRWELEAKKGLEAAQERLEEEKRGREAYSEGRLRGGWRRG